MEKGRIFDNISSNRVKLFKNKLKLRIFEVNYGAKPANEWASQ